MRRTVKTSNPLGVCDRIAEAYTDERGDCILRFTRILSFRPSGAERDATTAWEVTTKYNHLVAVVFDMGTKIVEENADGPGFAEERYGE